MASPASIVVDALEGGEVEEDGAGDDAILKQVYAFHCGAAAGAYGVGGMTVIHLVAVEQ